MQRNTNTLKLILMTMAILTAVILYNVHDNARREAYAIENACTWTAYGSHNICK